MHHFITLFLISWSTLWSVDEEARIKAMYIYKFIQNMEWPAEKGTEKYTIAVVGDTYLIDEASALAENKHINGRSIEVVNYTSDFPMASINVLFISNSLSDLLPNFQSLAKENAVLIVTESPGLAKKGAGINFFDKGGKLKFELSTSALEASGINASRSIIDIAKIVN